MIRIGKPGPGSMNETICSVRRWRSRQLAEGCDAGTTAPRCDVVL